MHSIPVLSPMRHLKIVVSFGENCFAHFSIACVAGGIVGGRDNLTSGEAV